MDTWRDGLAGLEYTLASSIDTLRDQLLNMEQEIARLREENETKDTRISLLETEVRYQEDQVRNNQRILYEYQEAKLKKVRLLFF